MRNRTLARTAGVILVVAVAFASRVRVSHVGRTLAVPHDLHMGVHFVLFALLAMLACFAAHSWRSRTVLFAAVLAFGYGTEFYEHTRDTYPVETPDVRMDTAGALTGMAASVALLEWTRRRSRRPVMPTRDRRDG